MENKITDKIEKIKPQNMEKSYMMNEKIKPYNMESNFT